MMSDNTPTERFDTVSGGAAEEAKKSRTLLYVLIGLGVLLLVAVLVLIGTLLSRPTGSTGDPKPSSSPTDSATPTPAPTESSASPTPEAEEPETEDPQPPAEETGARFKTFNAASSLDGCSPGGPGFDATYPEIQVSWKTAGADEAWIVMGTSDAADSQYMQIPLNGNQSDFQYPMTLSCSDPSTTYTITLVAPNGDHVQKHFTVQNTGEQF